MEKNVTVCFAPCPIIFDLDGTLIDSAPDIRSAANSVLDSHGIPALTLTQIRSFIGGGVEVLWRKITAATGLPPENLGGFVQEFMDLYGSATKQTTVFAGVTEALEILSQRGHPLGICTNKPLQPAKEVLSYVGLAKYFQHVIGGDSLPQRKPDPAPLRAAFTLMGADPQQPVGLYIGDSEYDATCAERLSVPFLLYTQGYRQSPVEALTHVAAFDHWSAVPDLVAAQVE